MSRTPLAQRKAIQSRQAQLRQELDSVLGETKNVTLEIGCGHGHFLAAYARSHSQEYCIGIDLLAGRVARAERKRAAAAVPNLHFIQADAWDLLVVWPESVMLSKTWILFPDPWPKRRHEDRRLISEAFLYLLSSHSSADATLYFRTDHIPYLEQVREELGLHPRWELKESTFPFEQNTVFQNRAPSFGSLVACHSKAW